MSSSTPSHSDEGSSSNAAAAAAAAKELPRETITLKNRNKVTSKGARDFIDVTVSLLPSKTTRPIRWTQQLQLKVYPEKDKDTDFSAKSRMIGEADARQKSEPFWDMPYTFEQQVTSILKVKLHANIFFSITDPVTRRSEAVPLKAETKQYNGHAEDVTHDRTSLICQNQPYELHVQLEDKGLDTIYEIQVDGFALPLIEEPYHKGDRLCAVALFDMAAIYKGDGLEHGFKPDTIHGGAVCRWCNSLITGSKALKCSRRGCECVIHETCHEQVSWPDYVLKGCGGSLRGSEFAKKQVTQKSREKMRKEAYKAQMAEKKAAMARVKAAKREEEKKKIEARSTLQQAQETKKKVVVKVEFPETKTHRAIDTSKLAKYTGIGEFKIQLLEKNLLATGSSEKIEDVNGDDYTLYRMTEKGREALNDEDEVEMVQLQHMETLMVVKEPRKVGEGDEARVRAIVKVDVVDIEAVRTVDFSKWKDGKDISEIACELATKYGLSDPESYRFERTLPGARSAEVLKRKLGSIGLRTGDKISLVSRLKMEEKEKKEREKEQEKEQDDADQVEEEEEEEEGEDDDIYGTKKGKGRAKGLGKGKDEKKENETSEDVVSEAKSEDQPEVSRDDHPGSEDENEDEDETSEHVHDDDDEHVDRGHDGHDNDNGKDNDNEEDYTESESESDSGTESDGRGRLGSAGSAGSIDIDILQSSHKRGGMNVRNAALRLQRRFRAMKIRRKWMELVYELVLDSQMDADQYEEYEADEELLGPFFDPGFIGSPDQMAPGTTQGQGDAADADDSLLGYWNKLSSQVSTTVSSLIDDKK